MIFDPVFIQCPYCFSAFEIELDPTEASHQSWSHDCSVCCRPIEVHARWDEEGHAHIEAHTDDA